MRHILNKFNGTIHSVSINDRKGPVHAVCLIKDYIDVQQDIIVSYCDYGTYWNYDKFLNYVRDNNLDGCVVCYKGFHPHMLGTDNYAFVKHNIIDNVIYLQEIQEKKPFTNNRMNEYASNGTYYFKNGLFVNKYFNKLIEKNIKINNEYYVSMVYNLMVEDGLKIGVYEIEHMLQWGTPSDLKTYIKWSDYFYNKSNNNDNINFEDKYNTTLILPMAGKGIRFVNDNYKVPKPLLDIDGLPMIIQAVNCLPNTNNKTFILLKEHIDKYNIDKIIKNNYSNVNICSIDYITEGQACTSEIGISNSNLTLEEPILISACDNGVKYDKIKYQSLLDDFSIDVIVWTFRDHTSSYNNPNMYAWLETDKNDNIISVSCKKFDSNKHNLQKSHVIIGTMFFRKTKYFIDGLNENYKYNIKTNNEYYIDDIINQNIKQGLNVKVFEVEHYICWGTPDDYKTYQYWYSYFDKK